LLLKPSGEEPKEPVCLLCSPLLTKPLMDVDCAQLGDFGPLVPAKRAGDALGDDGNGAKHFRPIDGDGHGAGPGCGHSAGGADDVAAWCADITFDRAEAALRRPMLPVPDRVFGPGLAFARKPPCCCASAEPSSRAARNVPFQEASLTASHAAQTSPAHTHPMLTGTVPQVFRLISLTCSFFSRKNIELLLFGVFVQSAGPWPLLVTQYHAEDRILGAEDLPDRHERHLRHQYRGECLPCAPQPALALQAL